LFDLRQPGVCRRSGDYSRRRVNGAQKKAASAGRARKSLSTYRAVSQSTIARKPDIADFLVESAAKMTVKEVREACLRKFGEETPSRCSIFRFIKDMKNAGMVPGRFR